MRLLTVALLLVNIVRRHDIPDARYLALGARFPGVVSLGRLGDATLISDRWLVTAAHVARSLASRSSSFQIRIDGKDYRIGRVVVHPLWRELGAHDIALVELTQVVKGVTPLHLYRGSSERN